ncbi:MAG: hypothetical protein H0W76_13135 [Pyrinomonadaceae bacterium]|nr:hypothetical protein [Pyrinomonadaceae bacterium]
MKSTNNHRQAPAMVEDKATEKLKEKARDWGLIVNAGKATKPEQDGKKRGGRK